jgi:hypothetical protein
MARKPNYDFERRERERLKAEKAEERAKLKAEKKAAAKAEAQAAAGAPGEDAIPPEKPNAGNDE